MYEYLTTDEDLERRMIRGRVLSVLEFNKIRDKVTSKARTAYGKKICSEMTPCVIRIVSRPLIRLSLMPMINAPTTAPGIEPIPPKTAATKALRPGIPPEVMATEG